MRRVSGIIVVAAAAVASLAAGGCSDFENGPFGEPLPSGAGGAGGEGGGAACVDDGACDVKTETCACGDCMDTAFCVPDQCVDDGLCTYDDACICDDCLSDKGCKPESCNENGACESFFEGCACADCATKLECLDNPEGGGGGQGGQGGS